MCNKKQKLYIMNNPVFSKRYLDYEIPDYCEIIDQTATIIIDENRSVTINYAGETRSLSDEELFAFLTESLNSNRKFVCYDAVDTHKKLLEIAASANDRRIVWDLSAKFSLWGLGILEQEIVWSTQSRAISFPNVSSIIKMYQVPESDRPTSFNEEQFELAHIRGNVIQYSSNVDGWDNLAYLDNLKIISEPTNVQPFAYAILTGILKPDILLDQRPMIEKYGELNEAISQLSYEFTNNIDKVSESEDVSDCLPSYVESLPGWLHAGNLYLQLSRIVVDCFVCGHSVESVVLYCQKLTNHPDVSTLVENMLGWLAARTTYRDYDARNFPWSFLAKTGIDPCVINPNLDDFTIVVDDTPLHIGSADDDHIDPMLRRNQFQATVRNALRGRGVEAHKRIWEELILPMFRERFEELGLSIDRKAVDVYDFFYKTSALSVTGKPGRPVYEIEKAYECRKVFKDDIIKSVAFSLLRHSAPLVMVAQNSFVLHVPDEQNTEEKRKEYVDLIHGTIRELLSYGFSDETQQKLTTHLYSTPPVTIISRNYWPDQNNI